jgi:DNA-binding XRE family transcriptional regulator
VTDFDELIQQIEQEAEAQGPEGIAYLHELRARFQLARELRAAREAHGLTQQRLAELAMVGQAEISRIENGDANPTVATLAQLADPLELDLHLVSRGEHSPVFA